jgi:hypothetical protein
MGFQKNNMRSRFEKIDFLDRRFSQIVALKRKIQKNFFLDILPGTKSPFLRTKKFPNFFWLQLVPGTSIEKKNTGCAWYQIRGLGKISFVLEVRLKSYSLRIRN